MELAVCAKDVKFYKWPTIDFLGAYEVPPECMSVKHISWCCDGKHLLVIKSKGEPLIAKAPTKIESKVATQKCVSLNTVSTGVYSKSSSGLIALGLENGEVYTLDVEAKDMTKYRRLPNGIQNLDYSFDCQNLLAGCFDGNIYLYDVKGRPAASFMVPNCYTLSTTMFSNYSNILAGASKEGTLALWNAETTDLQFSCKEHSGRITDIAFLENTVTSVSTDGYLCVYDLRTYKSISKCNLDGALSSLAYFPGTYDLAVGTYNQLRSYDIRNLNTPVRTLLINNGGHIKKIAASPLNITKEVQPTSDNKLSLKKKYGEDLSASGDFSITSNVTSDIPQPFPAETYEVFQAPIESQQSSHFPSTSHNTSQKFEKTYKVAEVIEMEKFVAEYLKYASAQYSEKMAQAFYALRINTSKQFICMGEKMDQSWNNFIAYLRYAGTSEKGSNSDVSERDAEKHV